MVIDTGTDIADLVYEDRISGRVYTDPEVFKLELEKIFYRTWVYVGHESEVAQGGDYKTTCIGRQPVIVTREPDDGQVYVLYNRCRHRGATVCQYEYGTSTYFRCAYHSWTYNNRGELVGVPFPKGYGETFDLREFGLVRVPRAASYRGFIFASLSPEGPSLEEYLGYTRLYIDLLAGRASSEVMPVDKVGYNGNWKLQMDNNMDGYHVTSTHQSMFEIRTRRMGGGRRGSGSFGDLQKDLGNGHGARDDGLDALEPGYDPETQPWRSWKLSIFPNLQILTFPWWHSSAEIRLARPIAVDRTEVLSYLFFFGDDKDRVAQLRGYEEFYGPAGFGNPDDREMFERVQKGLQAQGNDWVLMSRGLQEEAVDERGIRFNTSPQGEGAIRAFYRGWKQMMLAD